MYADDEVTPLGNTAISGGNWVEYILKTPLPNTEKSSETKQRIIAMLKPMMDVANRSNVKRWEIPEYLCGYDIVWNKFFIYERKGRFEPELLVLKSSIREEYCLELSRSIDMGQMAMIFQPQKIQHVFQRFADDTKKKLKFFKSRDPQNPMQNMEER